MLMKIKAHLPVGSGFGSMRTSNPIKNRWVQPTQRRDLRQLGGQVAGVTQHRCIDLDELVPKCRERSVLHGWWWHHASQEVAKAVRKYLQLVTVRPPV